ncbi:M61 family metallopeptidase [Zwartia sp.]|uniref:M61 family metallopeptidase n=1 Tax=Zwartia sp. TaxID=2978004 RepID=UPI003BB131B5
MNRKLKSKPLLYSLEPFDLSGHRLRATLRITEPDPKGQIISMPAWIPGSYLIRDFSRHVEHISAKSGTQAIAITKLDNHRWRVAPCQAALTITAVIYAWDLSVRGAHIDETHCFFNGTSVFFQVHGQEDHPCRLSLLPPPNPARWNVFTSLPQDTRANAKMSRNGFGTYVAENYDALIDHPVEMGTPEVIKFDACGAKHEMVFTGLVPNIDLKRIAQDVKKICEAQIRFFEPETTRVPFLDSAKKYVFMTMVTGDAYGGLEHRASTALMASRKDLPTIGHDNAPEGYQTFLGLVSHEYFHTWNVKRIKPAAFAPYKLAAESHTRLLWIFEGFTSYYDDLFLLRSGVIDRPTYLKTLGKQIASVMNMPGRHKQSVAESSFDAWTRYYKQDENAANAIISYYTKGSLVALALDLTIRLQTEQQHSLDDVMRILWERFGRDFYQGNPIGLSEKGFPQLVREATGVDVSDEIHRWAYGREDLPLKQLLATQGINMTWQSGNTRPSLDIRTRKQGEHLVIASALEGGAAHLAGLSAHDLLVAIDGVRVDAGTNTLESILTSYQPGQKVNVHVFRRDELRCFELTLASPPKADCLLQETSKP